jgi:hypothetical protein
MCLVFFAERRNLVFPFRAANAWEEMRIARNIEAKELCQKFRERSKSIKNNFLTIFCQLALDFWFLSQLFHFTVYAADLIFLLNVALFSRQKIF